MSERKSHEIFILTYLYIFEIKFKVILVDRKSTSLYELFKFRWSLLIILTGQCELFTVRWLRLVYEMCTVIWALLIILTSQVVIIYCVHLT